ncbi:hypothetical protein QS460_04890 [Liquorilactobacillus mali]|uniref:hypothetical protein n=1 Tax=Liquorilactobacillus mali TaxID=1618 RepID=UPI00264F1901|nr:hypothetical protein [Liquorilactobacillus mali]MDN7145260.1 hypothetical protein [Liquorilactobacillus mali]
MAVDASKIQIINTVSPSGDDARYTVNFTLIDDNIGISSGRILVDKDTIGNVTENGKPQLVLDTLKSALTATTSTANTTTTE